MKLMRSALCCLLLSVPFGLHAQAQGGRNTLDSIRGFVQGFYDWYVPKSLNESAGPAWNLAVKIKNSVFSPQLAQALREDSAAQAKAEGEIVGLDFDPFLNSQDPGRHYRVGKITQQGESYWVDVHSVSSGKMSVKPSVVAEVVQKNGQRHFVDFHYSNGHHLLRVLKELKDSREKPAPQG
jgi:hypothetical protein